MNAFDSCAKLVRYYSTRGASHLPVKLATHEIEIRRDNVVLKAEKSNLELLNLLLVDFDDLFLDVCTFKVRQGTTTLPLLIRLKV